MGDAVLQVKERDEGFQWEQLDPDGRHEHRLHCGHGIVVPPDHPATPDRSCTPRPSAFTPCEDVMGYFWLRVIVWFVVVAALFGNLTVFVVTLTNKLTVPKFLMSNLSTADFILGLYLLVLAACDTYTRGVYFNYAISWQYGAGCKVAGFLAVFSMILSIYTLTVLTIERWYAISHAINITKRLRLKQAAYIMAAGWTFSLVFASLPLVGVSSYSKTSICLPMETDAIPDKIYIFTLLLLNLSCFVVICASYIDMYLQVLRQRSAVGRKDAKVAKRMAVLVFTDFACLFPMAFFGLSAAAGRPLITLKESKILLVFSLPLNACANPFLYAITTQKFKTEFFSALAKCGICTDYSKQLNNTRSLWNPYQTSSGARHSRTGNGNPSSTGNAYHRMSQGSQVSLRSSYVSRFSQGGSPSMSPKLRKRSSADSVTSSTCGPSSPTAQMHTIVSTMIETRISINRETRRLSVVPESSPKRTSLQQLKTTLRVLRSQFFDQNLQEGPGVEGARAHHSKKKDEEQGLDSAAGYNSLVLVQNYLCRQSDQDFEEFTPDEDTMGNWNSKDSSTGSKVANRSEGQDHFFCREDDDQALLNQIHPHHSFLGGSREDGHWDENYEDQDLLVCTENSHQMENMPQGDKNQIRDDEGEEDTTAKQKEDHQKSVGQEQSPLGATETKRSNLAIHQGSQLNGENQTREQRASFRLVRKKLCEREPRFKGESTTDNTKPANRDEAADQFCQENQDNGQNIAGSRF